MGFFGNLRSIGLINDKLKRLESLLLTIKDDFHRCASMGEIQSEITHGRFILSEIADVVSNSPRSVFLAPYWFFGNKMELREICARVASMLDEFEVINRM